VADYGRKSIACGNKQPSQLLTIESGTTERSTQRSLVITINALNGTSSLFLYSYMVLLNQ